MHESDRSFSPSDTALILLNWHDESRTIAAAEAALAQNVYGQVVVLDNESTERSRRRLERALGASVTLMPAPENRGFGAAHNLALGALSDAIRFVMLLNTDAVIERESVVRLREHLGRSPGVAACAPVIYDFPPYTGRHVQTAGGDLRPWLASVQQRDHVIDRAPDYVTFAACMLRRSALPEAPFDEAMFMYWEDVDLCARLREDGYELAVVPDASAWHELSASAGRAGADLVTYSYWSSRVFARKQGGAWRGSLPLRGLASGIVRVATGRANLAGAALRGMRAPIASPAYEHRAGVLASHGPEADARSRPATRHHRSVPGDELNRFLDAAETSGGVVRYGVRHPLRTIRAARSVAALPKVEARLSRDAEGLLVAKWLTRSLPARTVLHALTAVLQLPGTIEEYVRAPGRQTLRRKVREAQRLGVTWQVETSPEAQRHLLVLAEARESQLSGAPLPEHGELLRVGLWLAAYGADGSPLLVAVVPVSGEWAMLRYFWTLSDGAAASASRYLMTQVLAEHLIRHGVRYLADPVSPMLLSNGLRQFQRMVGFGVLRVHGPRPTTRQLARAGLDWTK